MKILNRKDFLALQGQWLFSKYTPSIFDDLTIKIENYGERDFIVQQVVDAIESNGTGDFIDKLDDAEMNGAELALDFYYAGRDGCFDDDQLFAVWSKDDVKALIVRLQELVKEDYQNKPFATFVV